MAPPKQNLYEVLGLERDASSEDIRKAYRRKALQTHPDRLPQGASDIEIQDAAEQFRTVNNAYEVLNNQTNRQLYDKHGVWPPPNVQSQQPDPHDYFDAFGYRARHHNSSRYAGHKSPFDEDPFFSGFNRRHDQFRFNDPFVVFDQMFRDLQAHANAAAGGSRHRGPSHPFFGESDPFVDSFFGGSPMFGSSPFGSSFHSSFGSGPSNPPFGHDDVFGGFGGGGGMFPMIGFSNSAFQQGSSFGGGTSSRVEIRSQTINGVTHRVKKTVDNEGNEREERTYPDGRKEVLYNGIMQGQGPAQVEAPGRSPRRHRDHHRIEAPPEQRYAEPQTAEKKRHWYGW